MRFLATLFRNLSRRAARLELGGTGQVKDAVRDVRRGIWLEHFWQDVRTQFLSASGLNVLGVPPLLGRVFSEADGPVGQQPQRVVVLAYRFWQRHFGGRPEAVGQILYLNREPYAVIGVLPRQYFHTGPEIPCP